MTTISVYHNPHFLTYRGHHTDLIPPPQPIATVSTAAGTSVDVALNLAYQQTQHLAHAWWENEGVQLQVRSTSVGDLMADEAHNLFVVERLGFRPFQPMSIRPLHRLAAAYRRLDKALSGQEPDKIRQAAITARTALLAYLDAEGMPEAQLPILSREMAAPGDLITDETGTRFRVVARRLHPEWRAKRLVEEIPQAQLWLDGPGTWAVVRPMEP